LDKNQFNVFIENFIGPLDLLLHLIEKNEIDINDIPIAKITDQYMQYLKALEYLDLDSISEFLVMAATLLSIKARMLLPKPEKIVEEEEIDPREELVARLKQYKLFKEITTVFKEKEALMQKVHIRLPDISEILKKYGPQNPVENISVYDLLDTFRIILEKHEEPEPTYEVTKEEVSIQECMENILQKLASNTQLVFNELFPKRTSRLRIIVTFLALLELIKLKKIGIIQKDAFGKITIFLKEDALSDDCQP
jgi:segregation and condensation protein A